MCSVKNFILWPLTNTGKMLLLIFLRCYLNLTVLGFICFPGNDLEVRHIFWVCQLVSVFDIVGRICNLSQSVIVHRKTSVNNQVTYFFFCIANREQFAFIGGYGCHNRSESYSLLKLGYTKQ